MPERASLVTEEAVRAIMRGQTYRYNPYVTEDDLRVFLQAAEPHLLNAFKERLLSDEARVRAGRAAYEDFDPDGDWESLDEPLRMTWEGNTAAGIEALLSTLGASDG